MAKGSSAPILKLPHRSPKSKAKEVKLTGPIRIVHSDSSVSISSFVNVELDKKSVVSSKPTGSMASSKESVREPESCTGVEVEDEEVVETPWLCCRLFALFATCFEHVEDHVEDGKSWCHSIFSKKRKETSGAVCTET